MPVGCECWQYGCEPPGCSGGGVDAARVEEDEAAMRVVVLSTATDEPRVCALLSRHWEGHVNCRAGKGPAAAGISGNRHMQHALAGLQCRRC